MRTYGLPYYAFIFAACRERNAYRFLVTPSIRLWRTSEDGWLRASAGCGPRGAINSLAFFWLRAMYHILVELLHHYIAHSDSLRMYLSCLRQFPISGFVKAFIKEDTSVRSKTYMIYTSPPPKTGFVGSNATRGWMCELFLTMLASIDTKNNFLLHFSVSDTVY
jgi:hypothetical protein